MKAIESARARLGGVGGNVAATPTLPVRVKAGFGLAEIGLSATELMLQVYLLELYLRAGLSPLWAGVALTIAVIWDAVSDPLMGALVDRPAASGTLNRRRLWIITAGCFLSAGAFGALFSPQEGGSQEALFMHLLVWYLILNTALTMVGVPHLALVNDLARSPEDRADLFGWRLVMGGLGLLLGLSLPALVALFNEEATAESGLSGFLLNRSGVGVVLGVLTACVGWLSVAAVWRRLTRPSNEPVKMKERVSLWEGLKGAMRLPAFRLLLLGFGAISVGRALNASLALIFYKVSLGFEEIQVSAMLLTLAVSIMVAAPLWVLAARRYPKGRVCVGGIAALTVLTSVVYPLFPEGVLWPVLVFAVVGGALVASVVLLESLLSDVVELSRVESTAELSGSSYGLWRMVIKVSRAIGIALSAVFLWSVGYEKGAIEQSYFLGRAVAWAYGPGVALFFAIGGWLVWKVNRNLTQDISKKRE